MTAIFIKEAPQANIQKKNKRRSQDILKKFNKVQRAQNHISKKFILLKVRREGKVKQILHRRKKKLLNQ
jgi:hypothetical protein